MPRLTIKFLIKSFMLVVFVMFLLPIIMYHLDSQESAKAAENERKNSVKKDLGSQHKDANQLYKDDTNKGSKYGPKQEMKSGVMGNFEPEYVPLPGPGEGGDAVHVSANEKAAADRSVREYGFNMVASDKIAMVRNVPDTRMDECKHWHYPEDLPSASVIIVFHNEGWSTLMRTVHSVIATTPPQYLHEIVMVDDFSAKEDLKGKLDEYIKQFNGLVKLYRNEKRLGLILTRTMGAKYATGDVIVFLDAHCEGNKNWLVPLLARIRYDRTIMAVPFIDGVDWNNFRYRSVYGAGQNFRGIFEWGFLYKESQVPEREAKKHKYHSEPYWAPTHAGGLFAMDRRYFFELGAYDEGLQIWGGENFELSFKIWQCGGSIEWVPCSRVGHVYRNSMPYGFGDINPKIPVIQLNYMRVVEVWLDDEFKEYFYTREPAIRGYPIGNITKQLDFRKKYCPHSFKWFMDNVAYEVYDKFPRLPPNQGWGEIQLKVDSTKCIDSGKMHPPSDVIIRHCHHHGGTQMFRLNVKGQLAVGERCIDVQGGVVKVVYCQVQPEGPWSLDKGTGLLTHASQRKCVESDATNNKLLLKPCDAQQVKQQWTINPVWTWK